MRATGIRGVELLRPVGFRLVLLASACWLLASAAIAQTGQPSAAGQPQNEPGRPPQDRQSDRNDSDARQAPPSQNDSDEVHRMIERLGSDQQPVDQPQLQQQQANGPAVCVEDENAFVNALIAGGGNEFARGATPETPRNHDAQLHYDQALQHEKDIEGHLEREFGRLQGEVATGINQFLGASYSWQSTYAYVSSSTTGLQGLLQSWAEAHSTLTKADFAFALANLGVGVGKLGFKAVQWMRTPAQAVETAEGAAALAGAAEGSAAVADAANASGTAGRGVSASNGARPVAANGMFAPIESVTATTGSTAPLAVDLASAGAQWEGQVAKMQLLLKHARAQNLPQLAARIEADLKTLMAAKPVAPPTAAATGLEGFAQQLDRMASTLSAPEQAAMASSDAATLRSLAQTATEAGVDTTQIVKPGMDAAEAAEAVMAAIAKAKGWHSMPQWAELAVTNLLLQARGSLAGVQGARISPQTLELVQSLQAYLRANGLTLNQYLRTSAYELEELTSRGDYAMEIVLQFDAADVQLLDQVLAAGGDIAKLRGVVGPIPQVSLNALARGWQTATQARMGPTFSCANITNSLLNASQAAGASAILTQPLRPSEQDVRNVLTGTGQLGRVGLASVDDQFGGVISRLEDGNFYWNATAGEAWRLFTSPSATVGSYYYTLASQDELQTLFANAGPELVQLGTQMDDASRALSNLKSALARAGVGDPSSYLNSGGPKELQGVLDQLQRAYDSADPEWRDVHKTQMDEKRAHIEKKIADLKAAMDQLAQLNNRLGQLQQWLDSVRLNPDGSRRGTLQAFDPQAFVRLGSISLYLRSIGAAAFGLTNNGPMQMGVPGGAAPAAK